MLSYVHKGVDITVDDKGQFKATIAGALVRSPSLAAMQKRIDNASHAAFEPFNIIRIDESYGSHLDRKWTIVYDTVTGISVRSRKTRYSAQQLGYHTKAGQDHSTVILDTPDNRRIMKTLVEHYRETQRMRAEREKEARRLDESMLRRVCPAKIL